MHSDDVLRRPRPVREHRSYVSVCIYGAVITCALTIGAVLTAAIVRPENTSIIATIVGITTPVTLGLMGAGLQGLHKGVNGRMSQLLQATADRSETRAHATLIRQLHLKLLSLTPGSPEYSALLEQIRLESARHFDVIERRASTTPPNSPGAA